MKIDYEAIKSKDKAVKWAIENGLAPNKTEANKWLNRNIPKESYFQDKILYYLKELKADGEAIFFWKEQAGTYQRKGIPDIIVCYKGQFIGLEVKRPYIGQLSPLQRQTIASIRSAGGLAETVSTVGDVKRVLNIQRE